ncbi:hypothetical protein AAMO2058_001658100 [Amorphochlora amoebiformis]
MPPNLPGWVPLGLLITLSLTQIEAIGLPASTEKKGLVLDGGGLSTPTAGGRFLQINGVDDGDEDDDEEPAPIRLPTMNTPPNLQNKTRSKKPPRALPIRQTSSSDDTPGGDTKGAKSTSTSSGNDANDSDSSGADELDGLVKSIRKFLDIFIGHYPFAYWMLVMAHSIYR